MRPGHASARHRLRRSGLRRCSRREFPGKRTRSGADARILAQAADAIIFADTEGVIRIWNAAAARLRIPASRRSSWLPWNPSPLRHKRLESVNTVWRCARAAALLDRAYGESGDEAVDEYVVDERHRNADDQAGAHQRAPEVDVAANEERRHADAHRVMRRRGNEGQ